MCLSCNKTINAIVDSCFHSKKILSTQYITNWAKYNIPRLLFPLHRYAVHSLATSWRTLEESQPNLAIGKNFIILNDVFIVYLSISALLIQVPYNGI